MNKFTETLYYSYGQEFRIDELLHEVKTEHQHLIIFHNAAFGRVLILDGIVQTTERDEFIYQVASKRGLEESYVESLATGEVWTGKKSFELKLVDSLGSNYELKQYLEQELNESVGFYRYKKEVTLKDLFTGIINDFGFSIGKGVSNSVFDTENNIRIG